MLFSILITFFLIYKLLLIFKVNRWFAILYSIGITLLAPQVFRMGGHLALSYSVAIPLGWLLILQLRETKNKIALSFAIMMNNIFWLFIHSYLGMIVLFFQAAFLVVQGIAKRKNLKNEQGYFSFPIAILFPLLFFYLFAILTDTHPGRTDNPSGFFLYNAEIDDILLPSHAPLRPILDKILGPIINLKWEASAYIGLPCVLLLLVLLILSFISLIKKEKRNFLAAAFDSSNMNISLIASGIVLLFAMAFPFRIFPKLLEILPLLKQFRATGRFDWPFYFVATIFSVTVFQKTMLYLKSTGKTTIGYGIFTLAGLILVVEGWPYHTETADSISRSSNIFKKASLNNTYKSALDKIDFKEFQAILPFPFFYQGSESYSRPKSDSTVRAAIILSSHTGIPMVAANLTRTSIQESKNIVSLLSPAFYKKAIQSDIKRNKPFLIVTTNDSISKYEKEFLKNASPLFTSKEFSLFSLKEKFLFENTADKYVKQFELIKKHLHPINNFLVSNPASFIFYTGFDTKHSDILYEGTGAYKSLKKGKNTFAEFGPNTFVTNTSYDVSIWMYNDLKDGLNDWFRFVIEEYDEQQNSWYETTFFPESCEVINGKWSLMEGRFTIHKASNKVYVVTKGKDNSTCNLYVDELLIKSQNTDVYRMDQNNHTLFFNNHFIQFKP
jgi:hypothetical protein